MLERDERRDQSEQVEVETADVEPSDNEKSWPPAMEVKHAGFESGDDVEVKDAAADIAVNITETDDPFVFDLVGGASHSAIEGFVA